MALANDPVIDFNDEVLSVCHWGPLQVTVYWKNATLRHIQRLEHITTVYVNSCPNGFVMLSLLQPGNVVPTADVREAGSKLLSRFANQRRSAAMVLEYSGAMAQLLISILRGFNTLAGRKQLQLFGSLPEAAAHLGVVLTPMMGRPVATSEVLGVVERIRQLTRPVAKPPARAAL